MSLPVTTRGVRRGRIGLRIECESDQSEWFWKTKGGRALCVDACLAPEGMVEHEAAGSLSLTAPSSEPTLRLNTTRVIPSRPPSRPRPRLRYLSSRPAALFLARHVCRGLAPAPRPDEDLYVEVDHARYVIQTTRVCLVVLTPPPASSEKGVFLCLALCALSDPPSQFCFISRACSTRLRKTTSRAFVLPSIPARSSPATLVVSSAPDAAAILPSARMFVLTSRRRASQRSPRRSPYTPQASCVPSISAYLP